MAVHRKEILMLHLIVTLTHTDGHEDGASAVEYGLLVAGIAALVVGIVFLFGGVVTGSFQSTCDQVKSGGSSASQTCA